MSADGDQARLRGENPGPDARGQASLDVLTGALTRAGIDAAIDAELGSSGRHGTSCSLLLFDVDHFKSVNDVFGHLRGDLVLSALTKRILQLLRPADLLGRYGGDEFVCVLPGTAIGEARAVADRIVAGVVAAALPGDPPLSISVSLGVASFPADGEDRNALLAVADRRQYLAKRAGRGRAVAADDGTGTELRESPDNSDQTSGRLLERDRELAAARDFLARLSTSRRGLLKVTGPPGVGHTRFLGEVAAIARMQGFEVAVGGIAGSAATGTAGDAARSAPTTPRPGLLIVLDTEGDRELPSALLAERIRAALAVRNPSDVLGVVVAVPGRDADTAEMMLPVLGSVALAPWSAGALSIWLRTVLAGEPTPQLVSWLADHSQGLPTRARHELDRLIRVAALRRTDLGGWDLNTGRAGSPRTRYQAPIPVAECIGRQGDVAASDRMLGTTRLITLLGPGGIGKTRLALAVAEAVDERYRDGVVFVPLADTGGTPEVMAAVAEALAVAEKADQPLAATITEHLADRNLLLVLDNFEHVLPAADAVAALLSAAPEVSVLVTSRELLGLPDEYGYPVPLLTVPDLNRLPADSAAVAALVAESSAVQLFAARGQEVAYGFAVTAANVRTVAEICHRLDGLALAIELTAARLDQLSADELLAQLDRRLDLLVEGPRDQPARHQTLRAAIDWSVDLLEPADRSLFIRLGVFSGGFRVEAAAAVGDPATHDPAVTQPAVDEPRLAALVAKHLLTVQRDGDGQPRYLMLESVRAYAVEQLAASPERHVVYERHAAYVLALAEEMHNAMHTPEQGNAMRRVDADRLNVRDAFGWAIEKDPALAARICDAMFHFWLTRAKFGEARSWIDQVSQYADALPMELRIRLVRFASIFAKFGGDYESARRLGEECLAMANLHGDAKILAHIHCDLAIIAEFTGETALARAEYQRSLSYARAHGDPVGIATTLGNMAELEVSQCAPEAAARYAGEALELNRAEGNADGAAYALLVLGRVQIMHGDVPAARSALTESIELNRVIGDLHFEGQSMVHLARAELLDGKPAQAGELIIAALQLFLAEEDDGDGTTTALEQLARVIADVDPARAARLLGAAEANRERQRARKEPELRREWDTTLSRVTSDLGPDRAETELSTGRSMLIADAAADALAQGLNLERVPADSAGLAQPAA